MVKRKAYSYTPILDAIIEDTTLKAQHRNVYIVLSYLADKNISPTKNKICRLTGSTRQTVDGAIDALAQRGYVEVIEGYREDGGRGTNEYILHEDKSAPPPRKEKQYNPPAKTYGGELYHEVKDMFYEESKDVWDYKKEGASIKRLISKAEKINEEERDVVVKAMAAKFWELSKGGDAFWEKQPYLPSVLCSLWSRVYQEYKKQYQKVQEADDFMRLFDGN